MCIYFKLISMYPDMIIRFFITERKAYTGHYKQVLMFRHQQKKHKVHQNERCIQNEKLLVCISMSSAKVLLGKTELMPGL